MSPTCLAADTDLYAGLAFLGMQQAGDDGMLAGASSWLLHKELLLLFCCTTHGSTWQLHHTWLHLAASAKECFALQLTQLLDQSASEGHQLCCSPASAPTTAAIDSCASCSSRRSRVGRMGACDFCMQEGATAAVVSLLSVSERQTRTVFARDHRWCNTSLRHLCTTGSGRFDATAALSACAAVRVMTASAGVYLCCSFAGHVLLPELQWGDAKHMLLAAMQLVRALNICSRAHGTGQHARCGVRGVTALCY